MGTRTYSINLTRVGDGLVAVTLLWHDWQGRQRQSGHILRTRAQSRHALRMQVLDAVDQVLEQSGWLMPIGLAGDEHQDVSPPPAAHATPADGRQGA